MNALKFAWKFVLILLFAVITLVATLSAYSSYKKKADLKTWKPINATITSSTIEQEQRSRGKTYCPNVMVDYVFNGQTHNSKLDIEDGPCSPIQTSVSAIIEKFKQGTTVNAVVNPSKPTVIRIAEFSLGTMFYLMLVMALGGLTTVVFIWRTPANQLIGKKAMRT